MLRTLSPSWGPLLTWRLCVLGGRAVGWESEGLEMMVFIADVKIVLNCHELVTHVTICCSWPVMTG